MSATSRRHRRAVGSYRTAETLRRAADQPAVKVGTSGPYDVIRQYFLHEETCPAHDRNIDELVERTGWKGSA